MNQRILVPLVLAALTISLLVASPAISGPAPVCPPTGCYKPMAPCAPSDVNCRKMAPPAPYRPGYLGPPACAPVKCAPPTKCAPPSCGPAVVCAPPPCPPVACGPAPCPPPQCGPSPVTRALRGAYDLTAGILETPFWLVGKAAKGVSYMRTACSDPPIVCPPPYAQPISAMSPIAMTVEPKMAPRVAYARPAPRPYMVRPAPAPPRPAPYVSRPMPKPAARRPTPGRSNVGPAPMAPPASSMQGPVPLNHFQYQGKRHKPMADNDIKGPRTLADNSGGIFGSLW